MGTVYRIELSVSTSSDNNTSSSIGFYLHENNITIMCSRAIVGDKGIGGGIEYEAVDVHLLRQRRDEGEDLLNVCTSLIADMSWLFGRPFDQEIGNWDVRNVTTIAGITFNQPIRN